MSTHGVVVGRFQVPNLTSGQLALLSAVNNSFGSKMIVFLGISPTNTSTKNNPISFLNRAAVIRSWFKNAIIIPIKDVPSNKEWSQNLDATIKSLIGLHDKAICCGSRDSFLDQYEGVFEKKYFDLPAQSGITATNERLKCRDNEIVSEDFRRGCVWATQNQFDNPMPTVDIAPIYTDPCGLTRLVLGRKEGESKYRFIGGFVDTSDKSLAEAAARELYEETDIDLRKFLWTLKYVGSAKVDDWRWRGESKNVITTLFVVYISKLDIEQLKAKDDIKEIRLFSLDELSKSSESILMDNHRCLLNLLLDREK